MLEVYEVTILEIEEKVNLHKTLISHLECIVYFTRLGPGSHTPVVWSSVRDIALLECCHNI